MDQSKPPKSMEGSAGKSGEHHTQKTETHDSSKRFQTEAHSESAKKPANSSHHAQSAKTAAQDTATKESGKKAGSHLLPSLAIDLNTALEKTTHKLIDKANDLKSDAQRFAAGMKHAAERLELPKPKEEIYLDGTLTSPDKQKSLKIVHNEILDNNEKKLGTIDPIKGKVTFTEDAKEQNKDINSYLNQWKFEGKENGKHERVLVTNSDISNGRVMLAQDPDAPRRRCDVRMGMLIDSASGEQLGTIKPPREVNGKYEGGSITFKNGKELALTELNGTSLELELMGQTGKQGRSIRIYSTDAAQDKLVDLNKLTDDAKRNRNEKSYAFADESSKSFTDVSKYWNQLSGRKEELQKDSEKAEETYRNAEDVVERLLTVSGAENGASNHRDLFNEFKIKHAELKEQQHTQVKDEKIISLRELKSEDDTNKVNANLRIGNDLYQIERGDVYRINENGHERKRDIESCGKLKPGYKIAFDDGRQIDLHSENRVILSMQFEGESERHEILGLGANRKAADGSSLPGGLVDRRALEEEARIAASEAEKGNTKYFENKPIITSGAADYFMGGREAHLESIKDSVNNQREAIKKELDQLFSPDAFNTDEFDNNRIDQNLRATTNFMRDLNLSAQDSQQLAEHGIHLQHSLSEGATIAVTTLATLGVGTVVGGMVKAGRLSSMAGLGAELTGCTLAGGSSSVIMRHTRATDSAQVGRNFVGGMFEGATMFTGNAVARTFAEIKSLVPAQRIARELEIVNGTGATTYGGKILNYMAGSRSAEMLVSSGVKLGNAAFQTAGFTLAGAAREKEGNWSDYLSAGKLATGTLWFLTGDLIGSSLSHGISKLNKIGANSENSVLNTLAHERAKDTILSRQISSIPATTTTMFTFSSLGAVESAYDAERKRLAKEQNKEESEISLADVWANADKGAVLRDSLSQGAMAAIFSPVVALGHGGMEAISNSKMPSNTEIQRKKSSPEPETFYSPNPDKMAIAADIAGKIQVGDLGYGAAMREFVNVSNSSIERLVSAAKSDAASKGKSDSSSEKQTAKLLESNAAEAASDRLRVATKELEKDLNAFLEKQNLPKIEVELQDLASKECIPAYYENGKLVINSRLGEYAETADLRRTLYHELTHHDQTALVIRKVMDEQGIGSTATKEQLQQVIQRCEEITARKDGKENALGFTEKMAAEVLTLRDGNRLSKDEAQRADKIASDIRDYVDLPNIYSDTNSKHKATVNQSEKLDEMSLTEFLKEFGASDGKKHWWGADSTAESQMKLDRMVNELAKLPAEKSREFLATLLRDRSKELNAVWEEAFDKYMRMPELEAYRNALLMEEQAKSVKIESTSSQSEQETNERAKVRDGSNIETGMFSFVERQLDPNDITLTKLSKEDFLDSMPYLMKAEDYVEALSSQGLSIPQIQKIETTYKQIREGLERDHLTLPLDVLKTDEQKFALAWHVLWESIRINSSGREIDTMLRYRGITNPERISYALLALTAGTSLPEFPTLSSVLQKFHPNGITSTFGVPLHTVTEGNPEKNRINFPISEEIIEHHFKDQIDGVRQIDPQHIYKSHLVWQFFKGMLPEGMKLTDFERVSDVGGSGSNIQRARKGYQYTLDYETSAKVAEDGTPLPHRNPITVIIDEVSTSDGTHWNYKTHFEKYDTYKLSSTPTTAARSNPPSTSSSQQYSRTPNNNNNNNNNNNRRQAPAASIPRPGVVQRFTDRNQQGSQHGSNIRIKAG